MPAGQLPEQFGNAGVGAAVAPPAKLVFAAIIPDDGRDLPVPERTGRKGPPDHLLDALTDEELIGLEPIGLETAAREDAVHGRGDVLDRVEERPVEVEDDRPV